MKKKVKPVKRTKSHSRRRYEVRIGYKCVRTDSVNYFWKGEHHIWDKDLKRFVNINGQTIEELSSKKRSAILSNAELKGEQLNEAVMLLNHENSHYEKEFSIIFEVQNLHDVIATERRRKTSI